MLRGSAGSVVIALALCSPAAPAEEPRREPGSPAERVRRASEAGDTERLRAIAADPAVDAWVTARELCGQGHG